MRSFLENFYKRNSKPDKEAVLKVLEDMQKRGEKETDVEEFNRRYMAELAKREQVKLENLKKQ